MPRGVSKYTKNRIRFLVAEKGSSLRQISIQAGLNGDAGSHSLTRAKPAANKAIADFLGISMHELWPDWYAQDGNRISARSNAQNLARPPAPVSANSAHSI